MHEHRNCNIKYNIRPRIYASDLYVTSTHAEISTPINMAWMGRESLLMSSYVKVICPLIVATKYIRNTISSVVYSF